MYNTNYGMYNYARQPYYTQPNYQQAQQPVYQQPQPVDLPINDVRFLTADQIKGFIVYPNTKVLLIDKQNGLAYLESADNMGNFYKQVFTFKNFEEKPELVKENTPNNLVTKEDLQVALENFRLNLEKAYQNSTKDINSNNLPEQN